MIISRYLTKEILGTLLGVTFILLLIFLSNQLVRYLSYAADGKIATNILLQLMGFEIPYLLALLLPLGLYLGIILAYGRMYAESELRVLQACGLSPMRLIGITGSLALVVTAIVFVLMLWVNPWIASQKDKIIAHGMAVNNILNTLMPGRFQVISDGQRVVYVERISHKHKQVENLFIAEQEKLPAVDSKAAKQNSPNGDNKKWIVLLAARGAQVIEPKTHEHFMAAIDGYRYDGMPGQNDYKIMQFKKYSVRLPHMEINSKRRAQEAFSTAELWDGYHTPENAAELQWRLSIPISAFILGLLAIPLSQIRPRYSRYSQLFPALLLYIVYVNILFVARNWVEQGYISVYLGIWWVHGVALLGALAYVFIQAGWDIKRFLRVSS